MKANPNRAPTFLPVSGKTKWIFSTSWFLVPGGTIWGTTWFEVRGRIDRESVKGRAVELVVDLGWKRHRGPGFQAEGLCYRPDGSVIKAVNPDNCWIPLIDANGVANVELDDAGRFTVYVEAASNPLVEADLPFAPMNLGERADGRPSDYVLTTMDVCAFNQNVFDYLMDLETVTSLMRELKDDDDPRYWQLAKALQRSLNTYDERDIAGTLEPAKEKLAGVLSEPAYSSVIHHVAVGHAHIDSAWLWPVRETHRKVARTVSNVLALMDEDTGFHVRDEFRPTVCVAGTGTSRPVRAHAAAHQGRTIHSRRRNVGRIR